MHSFLAGPARLPDWTTTAVARVVGPVVSSPFVNANKAIVLARRRER